MKVLYGITIKLTLKSYFFRYVPHEPLIFQKIIVFVCFAGLFRPVGFWKTYFPFFFNILPFSSLSSSPPLIFLSSLFLLARLSSLLSLFLLSFLLCRLFSFFSLRAQGGLGDEEEEDDEEDEEEEDEDEEEEE